MPLYIVYIKSYLSLVLVALLLLTATFETGVTSTNNKYFIGVHPERRQYYEVQDDKQQEFKCLDGSGSIPFNLVNDDYCDCQDASDEPGTAACPDGRFYCSNEGFLARLIPSAWVNDGKCDCCDTSDEYNNSEAKCENTCGILGEQYRQEQAKFRETADQGSALRSQYKEQAKQKKEQNQQLLEQYRRELSDKELAIKNLEQELAADYGPSNVFLPLKGQCYSFKDREYTYTLCPFERATQESTSGMQTELGRYSGWAGPAEDPYSKQKYEGGIQCWNGPARSALINIECGVEDKVTAVIEPAKCEYVYNFITPAACPDTDPPEPVETPSEQPITQSSAETEIEGSPDFDDGNSEYTSDQEEPEVSTMPATGEKHDELW